MGNILVVPDLHIPFQVKDVMKFLTKVIKSEKIDQVVFTGDLVDLYAFSRFAKDPDSMNIGHELKEARKILSQLYKVIPKAKVCIGNHEMRLYKQAAVAGIPGGLLKTLPQILEAPKGYSFAENFIVDDILFTHGDGLCGRQAAFKLIERYRRNVVIGHLHAQMTITYLNNGVNTNWAVVAGCLVDKDSYALAYGKYFGDKPVLGVTVIKAGVPNIIPLT